MERIATIHSRRRPIAVGAGVEFYYFSSDSFVALNEEATKDSVSSPREAFAVTEKPTVLLTPVQTSAQLPVMKDTGSLRRLRGFFSLAARMIRDVGENMLSKLSEASLCKLFGRWR